MNSNNEIQKANLLLAEHANLFSNYLGAFFKDNHNPTAVYYFDEYSKYARTELCYKAKTKLFSSLYSLKVRTIMTHVVMDENWNGSVEFTGRLSVKGARIKVKGEKKEMISILNKDEELMNGFVICNKCTDLLPAEIIYKKERTELEISIYPYAGAFICIKIPPVFYPLRMNKEEIYAICRLINMLYNKFTKS